MSPSAKSPSEPRVGMKADEVLKLKGRAKADAIAPAEWIEKGKRGVWHYADIDVILEHDGTLYRVKEIVKRDVPG